LSTEFAAAHEALRRRERENQKLMSQHRALEKVYQEARSEIARLTVENGSVRARPTDMEQGSNFVTLREELQTARRRIEALETELAAKNVAVRGSDEDAKAQREEVGTLQSRIRELEGLNTDLKRAADGGGAERSTDAPEAATRTDHRIRPGDVLEVLVWKNAELTRTVTVLPEGTVFLPLLNQVPAAGSTPEQLRQTLVARLSEYIPTPEVSVLVNEVKGFSVSVIGEVKTAGQYEIQGKGTVLDALALAGGLSEFASPSGIGVLRQGEGGVERLEFEYRRAIAGDPTKNFALQPNDIVVVP